MADDSFVQVGFEKPVYWDARYLRNVEKLSKPIYAVKAEKDTHVPMRDGTKLCADVFRPDSEGTFPVLVAASGYSKDIQSLDIPPQPMESLVFDHTIEAGHVDFFVRRGYAYVIADVRGTGKSEGEWHGPYSKSEQVDYYDLIEWAATQPWSNGKAGMIGISWYGVVQFLAAEQQPPHLKAVFPFEAFIDHYRWAYNGGIIATHYWDLENKMVANNPKLDSERLYGKQRVKEMTDSRLEDPDIKFNPYFVRILSSPGITHTAYKDMLINPNDGPFWRERSPCDGFDKIRVPVYHAGLWGAYTMARGVFEAFNDPSLSVPKKAGMFLTHGLYGGPEGSQLSLPFHLFSPEILRWYDHWLKGIDTGIMEEPPIKILVVGKNRFRYEREWPLSRTKWVKFYLRRFGRLAATPEESDVPPDPLVHRPPTISNEIQTLRYVSPPFNEPMEITGPVALHFHASLDQDDGNFIFKMYDVQPNKERVFLEKGLLKASQRELDEKRSKPWLPRHTYANPKPVSPGEVYEYAVSMNNISCVFKEGHQLLLEMTTADPLVPQVTHHKMTLHSHTIGYRLTYYKIFRDAAHQSHLLLPFIRDSPEDLWIR